MQVLNSLAPVFLIIAVGVLLGKTEFLSAPSFEGLNKLTYWVGLPCLLFYKIATAVYSGGTAGLIFLVVLVGMTATVLMGYIMAWVLKVPALAVGTFVQAAFRGNLAFIGLPVIIYLSEGADSLIGADVEMLGILVMAPIVPIHNIISVTVLLLSQHELKRMSWRKVLRPAVTNPLLLASLAGGLIALLSWHLPFWISRTTETIGRMSLPLALIGIGGSLGVVRIRGSIGLAFCASILKTVFAPLIGLLTSRIVGLGAEESRIALIYLACPTAVASYVVASQLGGDSRLAASSVALSTILSVFALGLVVALS